MTWEDKGIKAEGGKMTKWKFRRAVVNIMDEVNRADRKYQEGLEMSTPEHTTCFVCGKIGHRADMVIGSEFSPEKHLPEFPSHAECMTAYSQRSGYCHEVCGEDKFKVKKCPCGKGYISKLTGK